MTLDVAIWLIVILIALLLVLVGLYRSLGLGKFVALIAVILLCEVPIWFKFVDANECSTQFRGSICAGIWWEGLFWQFGALLIILVAWQVIRNAD
jgi:hypothetical protein